MAIKSPRWVALSSTALSYTEGLRETQTHVMLLCQLGFEVGIAHVGIVEVVESGIAVALFIESIEAQVLFQAL